MPLEGIRKKRPVKIMHENRLAKFATENLISLLNNKNL